MPSSENIKSVSHFRCAGVTPYAGVTKVTYCMSTPHANGDGCSGGEPADFAGRRDSREHTGRSLAMCTKTSSAVGAQLYS